MPWLAALYLLSTLGWQLPADASHPPPQMVADVATEVPFDFGFYQGQQTVRLDGHLYFLQDDGVHGLELWRSNGTGAGTGMVVDFCPGYCPGAFHSLVVADDRLFFVGDDGTHGRELITSDGTAAGTVLVLDAQPGSAGMAPQFLTAWGSRVVFSGRDVEGDQELWISDGTPAGTLELDLTVTEGGSRPGGFVTLDDGVVFSADDGIHGREPWITDGTPEGTRMLGDLSPGGASMGDPFEEIFRRSALGRGDSVIFTADDDHGSEPWITDGTPEGTRLLADLTGDSTGSSPGNFTAGGDEVFFVADSGSTQGVYRTDGATVSAVYSGPPGESVTILGLLGDRLLLTLAFADTGHEPWSLNPDDGTITLLADTLAGTDGGMTWAQLLGMHVVGDLAFFFADDGEHGIEPWVTDGTPAGTTFLRDAWPGTLGQFSFFIVRRIADLGGRAIYHLEDGDGLNLWSSDGTPAGTERVHDFDVQTSSMHDSFLFHFHVTAALGPHWIAALDDVDHGFEPWISGGTPGTTRLLGDIEQSPPTHSSEPQEIVGWNGHVLLRATADRDEWRDLLWSSDLSTPPQQIDGPDSVSQLTAASDGVYFQASDVGDKHGSELWRTDGSQAGTRQVADLRLGPEGSGPSAITPVGDLIYFFATTTEDTRNELWVSDGSEAGTRRVAAPPPSSGIGVQYPAKIAAVGDLLFFTGRSAATGTELWVSDVTDGSIREVVDLAPGSESGLVMSYEFPGIAPIQIIAVGSRVAVVGNDGESGAELWASDGTAVGTSMVRDVFPGPRGGEPLHLTSLGDQIFFSADDGGSGRELWVSDLTEAGTRRVADLAPGSASSLPRWLTPVDGLLYFAAFRPDVGVELWRTDGTEPGTELVADIAPGVLPSTPEGLTVAGRRLFFTANDGEHGFEPWALLLPSRLPRLSLSVSGSRILGGEITILAVLHNPPPEALPDAHGDELTLPLPPELELLGYESDRGAVGVTGGAALGAKGAAAAGGTVVTWNGSLGAGEAVTLTLHARLPAEAVPGGRLTLSAETAIDTDGDGVADTLLPSDDPSTPEAEDATVVEAASILEVPTTGTLGTLLFALLLTAAALRRLS